VTELLEGSLFCVLYDDDDEKKVALTEEQRLRCALHVAYGLSALHLAKPPILHRDLKSANVLFSNALAVFKISDLGLARVKQHSTSPFTKGVGTPLWMAPEVFDGDDAYDQAADMYSLGMFFELVTGTLPFGGRLTAAQVMKRVCVDKKRPELPASVSPAWRTLISECWAHDPKQRPTIVQVVTRLEVMDKVGSLCCRCVPCLVCRRCRVWFLRVWTRHSKSPSQPPRLNTVGPEPRLSPLHLRHRPRANCPRR